jgi:SSS family solute:Na+ symporter
MFTDLLASSVESLNMTDKAVLVLYLVAIVGIGCWAGIRSRKGSDGGEDYFLAGGSLRWPMIGLALFSTNISTIHLVGFAQEGYKNGLVAGNFEWMAPFLLIVLALFFAPFYIRSRVATLPDFLERRYNRASRDWLAVLSIVSAIFIHIGFTLYTGAVVLKGLFGIPIMYSIVGTALLTGLYTIVGGLMAVVVTESIQTVVLLAGSILLTIFGLIKVGGWGGIVENVDAVQLTMLRAPGEPGNMPWYSVFLGYPVIGLWYWCADQTIVQRVLGAKDENHARVGPLFAGFIKVLPVFIFVLPGLILVALINQGHEGFAVLDDSKDAYAYLIKNLLPTGLTGVMAAALLAALMSTVSGALNSIATLFSYDLYKRWKPNTPDKKLVFVGRIATFVAMIVAIVWSQYIGHFEGIYQGCISLICYVAPPITAVFLLGVFWRRASGAGAIVTLVTGSILGFVVFLLEWNKESTGWTMPAMLAGFYLCMICIAIHISVSIFKPHIHTADSETLVWGNPLDCLKAPGWKGIGDYRILSALLFVMMVTLYIIFR